MFGKGGHTLCDNDLREGEAVLIQGKEKESRKHYDHIQYQGKKNLIKFNTRGKDLRSHSIQDEGGKRKYGQIHYQA